MFNAPIKECILCERLVGFRCENQILYPNFYNGAVPSFGELDAKLLIVGLAPGLKGANATGRPFTGDFAGDVLYPALLKAGFATQDQPFTLQSDVHRAQGGVEVNDGLELMQCRVTNAVRCLPPENKPTTQEISTCNAFLAAEIAAMPKLRVILTLGLVSHKAVLKALSLKQSAYVFGHGAVHSPGGKDVQILNSYHTSRYNMNTGRLTTEMFDMVIAQAKQLVGR